MQTLENLIFIMIDNKVLYINELINVYNYFKSIPKAIVKKWIPCPIVVHGGQPLSKTYMMDLPCMFLGCDEVKK